MMMTQNIDVAYSPSTGIEFYDEKGQFDGDLVSPSGGATFNFRIKGGSTGWEFNALAVDLVDGPDVAKLSWTVQKTAIQLVDPGNGSAPQSDYDYTLTIETTVEPIETVSIDPRIRNTGGN
jgi:hypothetical protein